MKSLSPILIGCAGWNVPKESAAHFPAEGSHLARYAQALTAVEINSSFYRPHRVTTYARWAASVPPSFRFAVKMPKRITHELLLAEADAPLAEFLKQVAGLGDKLGCLLVQLPPRLALDRKIAGAFFKRLRGSTAVPIACEPRHATWFTPSAEKLLAKHAIARVAADPALVPAAALPDDWSTLAYYRLHGSPRMYYSTYSPDYLQSLASALREQQSTRRAVWCIFDNTAVGAATENALELLKLLSTPAMASRRTRRPPS
jgi:uncharacterized protein YecE (DUF72 family)